MNRRLTTITVLLLGVVLFFAINLLAGAALRSMRLDLTEGRLYTLASGSRAVAKKVSEPIKLTLFFSKGGVSGIPDIQAYGARVREVLEQFARDSGGKITLEVVDPEPFSDAEDRAVQAGVAAVPIGNEPIYFGLLGTNSTDGRETIAFFDPGQEQFLEYQVAKLIYALDNPQRPVVGLISTLNMGAFVIDPMTQQPQPQRQWQVLTEARRLFEVRDLETNVAAIPDDVRVLWIVHPKDLPETTQYAIDQFILRGGRAVVFVDPHCEADIPRMARNQFDAMMASKSSDLPRLFEAWGIELESEQVAADKTYALQVPSGARQERTTHILYMAMDPATAMASADPVTGSLVGAVNMGTVGILKPRDGAMTTFTPLIQTSDQAMRLGLEKVRFMPQPNELLASYLPGGQRLTVMARVEGSVKTAFPAGKPPPAEGQEPPAEEAAKEHLTESTTPASIIVVADADMMTDNFWAQQMTLGDLNLGIRKFGENGDLLIGALDNLTGSGDLIALRARGKFQRPFTRVAEMQKAAETKYRAEQQSLETKIREAEQRINELQQARPGDAQRGVILSPEQEAELARVRQEMVDSRVALRQVRHNLRKDIESLNTRLLVANAGLIPLVVTIAAVGLGAVRVARRRSSKGRGG